MAHKRISLAEQLAQLAEPAPVDLDPEDLVPEPDSDGDRAPDSGRARAHYLAVGPSALRRLADGVSDRKYEGVRTSRKHLLDDASLSDADRGASAEEGGSDGQSAPASDVEDDEDDHVSAEDRSPPTPPSLEPQEPTDDLTSTLRQKRAEDLKKGKAVARQLALWDALLDARIRLQKSATAGNRLPSPNDLPRFTADADCARACSRMVDEALALADELAALQEGLLTANTSIALPARKRRRTDLGAAHIHEHAPAVAVRDATAAAAALEHAAHPWLVQTLGKWSAKIQAVAPSALLPATRNAFARGAGVRSAVQLADDALADRAKLVARTRVRRGQGARVGAPGGDEQQEEGADEEVFDDADFYQQLLRDVIDARGAGAGAAGGEDWVAAQRQKKARKKVDTKASKGRKLRYEVHEKLQNFMVPVPTQGNWHEEQIDELFASLLGKGFESALGVDADEAADGGPDQRLDEALGSGFRVFG